jgi:CubicO group peptidase (beta-lactamase class C family)
MRRALLLLAAVFSIHALPIAGQQPSIKRLDGSTLTSAEIDATVTRVMRAAEVTGVGIAIFNNNQIVYLQAYGVRDKEKNLPLTPDSVMTAASLSKSAFATVVMQLVEDGVLNLDKPVYQYLPKPLPEYPFYRDLAGDPRYKQSTLAHAAGPHQRIPQLAVV